MTQAPSEKHLEDWIVANPEKFAPDELVNVFCIERIIGRQYRLPSGILDILAINTFGTLLAFELKQGAIDSKAYTQAMKYSNDLFNIWASVQGILAVQMDNMNIDANVMNTPPSQGFHVVLVGSHIKKDNTQYVCYTEGISTVLYDYLGDGYKFSLDRVNPSVLSTNADDHPAITQVFTNCLLENHTKDIEAKLAKSMGMN